MSSLSNHPKWELVAVCDVDTRNFESKKFGEIKKQFPGVRMYQDWREALEKEAGNVDSVNVSVPDHMHAPIGMAALAKGPQGSPRS